MKTREERFKEEYVPWVLEHKKYPSSTSKNKIEKSLGIWRHKFRSKNFKPLLDFDKEVNFRSRKSPEERFEEYKSWVSKYKKYPSPYSDDEIEKSLGIWRNFYKEKKFKPLLDFDEEVNFRSRKLTNKSPEKRFKEDYVPWVLEHKKYPSQHSDDEIERSLGNWRSIYRSKKFKPLLDFDEKVNFSSPKSPEERFEEEYIPWVLKYKKYPSPKSNDKTEKSLGYWRHNYRYKIEQLKNFDIFYSNYLIGNKKTIETFNELKEKGII